MIQDAGSLPSDSTFREDINQLKLGKLEVAETRK